MSGKSVPMSPKHGLNPTIPVCLYCGCDKGEVAVCGKINADDNEMPMRSVIDALPCDKCRALWQNGVALLRADKTKRKGMLAVKAPDGTNTLYLNGDSMLITEEAAQRTFGPEMKKGDVTYLDAAIFDKMYHDWEEARKAQEKNETAKDGPES